MKNAAFRTFLQGCPASQRLNSVSFPRRYCLEPYAKLSSFAALENGKESITPSDQVTAPVHHTAKDLTSRFGQLWDHPDLQLARLLQRFDYINDRVTLTQEVLLDAALRDFLPKGQSRLLRRALLGHQHVHFRPKLTQAKLLPDGTDSRFLPGSASTWPYRLWAGGSTGLLGAPFFKTGPSSYNLQREYVDDVRIVGTSQPERVFVTIRKEIGYCDKLERFRLMSHEDPRARLTWNYALSETYTLCFLREPPGNNSKPRVIKPPADALFSHTTKPDANLLFQFSALTHNAHKIHLDPSFAQQRYKFKAPVVHGPLMMVMMVDFLYKSLQTYSEKLQGDQLSCQHIDYRNFAPLYVDEDLTLCCKPIRVDVNQEPWQAKRWQVWIQTGNGDNASLAVRGIVDVTRVPTPLPL